MEGVQWRESNYGIAVYYKGEFYSDEVLHDVSRGVTASQWCLTDYIIDKVFGFHEDLGEDVIKYLEDDLL